MLLKSVGRPRSASPAGRAATASKVSRSAQVLYRASRRANSRSSTGVLDGSLRFDDRLARSHLDDLEMLDLGVEAREELPVARVVTGPLVVLSREGLDGLDRIPQGKGREFDFGALVLTEEPRAAVPGRAGVVGQTRLLQILDVGLLLRFPHRPTPHSRDHRVLLAVNSIGIDPGSAVTTSPPPAGADREATE